MADDDPGRLNTRRFGNAVRVLSQRGRQAVFRGQRYRCASACPACLVRVQSPCILRDHQLTHHASAAGAIEFLLAQRLRDPALVQNRVAPCRRQLAPLLVRTSAEHETARQARSIQQANSTRKGWGQAGAAMASQHALAIWRPHHHGQAGAGGRRAAMQQSRRRAPRLQTEMHHSCHER
jgi:hypothetical protein